jgi:hypothetical protein
LTKIRRSRAARLVFILSVVALLTLVGSLIWAVRIDEGPAVSSLALELHHYDTANHDQLSGPARRGHDVIIVKGLATKKELERPRSLNPSVKLVNYEQAFALNNDEAEHARARGWLATTCSGQEISPQNFPRATLLDATIVAAREWRTDLVARETLTLDYDSSYLDTLRSYFPADFYDGLPCKVSDEAWLKASIDTIDLVQEKTGRAVIANGRGMQNGLQYFGNRDEVDRLMATADAVQVEHFGRFRNELDRDVAFVEAIRTAGKDPYVKCRRPGAACRDALVEIASRGPVYLSVAR